MALTAEESKKLLDELFALPDAKPKKEKKAPAKTAQLVAKPTPSGKKSIFQQPAFTSPTVIITTVTKQVCTTCGSAHEYISNRRIRFETKKPFGVTFECPGQAPMNLPQEVENDLTYVEVCPTCIRLSRHIDDFLALSDEAKQLALFPGVMI